MHDKGRVARDQAPRDSMLKMGEVRTRALAGVHLCESLIVGLIALLVCNPISRLCPQGRDA